VEVSALSRRECDVLSPPQVTRALVEMKPSVIINCAASTAVDAAEVRRHEAWRVNAEGPAVVANAVAHSLESALVIQMSTDYVFSGYGNFGRPITEGVLPDPRSSYGRSKLAGESALRAIGLDRSLVVRTSWLYEREGNDFVGRVRSLALSGATAEVVNDQWGSPTFVDDLAIGLCGIAKAASYRSNAATLAGVIHVANSGFTSRFRLAQEVYRLLGLDPGLVRPVTSASGDGVAPRPGWSALASDRLLRLGVQPLRNWWEALVVALEDHKCH